MTTTYLQGVNSSILESGVDLDELTSSNFASTTDPLAKRFKLWYNQALKEIQLERNEWQYMTKQAQLVIYPRVHVIDGNRSVAPPADSEFTGDDSGASFTVVTTTLLDGTWAGGDAEAYIDYLSLSGMWSVNELFDEDTPTVANTDVFRVKWWGRYDLESDVTDLLEPNYESFSVQGASGLSDTDLNTGDTSITGLKFVEWADFNNAYEYNPVFNRPLFITKTPNGEYDFYPRPDQAYILTFQYSAEPETLTLYSDTITKLPALYHDMVVWRTVMYYADYDSKPSMFARAERRYEYYKNRIEKNQMPQVTLGFNRYASSRFPR